MKVTLEMIDELRGRVNVSYEEAKEALEDTEGDIVKAIIQLERKRNYKNTYNSKHVHKQAHSKIQKIMAADLIIKKGTRTYLHLPLIIGLIIMVFTMPFGLVAFGFLILAGFKIRISKGKKNNIDINEKVDIMASRFKETAEKLFEEDEELLEEQDSENEITIE